MTEIMYGYNSGLIVALLFFILVLAVEAGFRFGLRMERDSNDSIKTQINTIQASLLGVLALLLGFTFSLSLQRYDTRSQAVVAEANAIGTALLRAELLPASFRSDTLDQLRAYLDLRVQAGSVSLDREEDRAALIAESNRMLESLWRMAVGASAVDSSPVTTGLYLQALNDVIDSFGTRDAALNRHVPEIVLFLLFGTFALTSCLVGYASGLSGHRTSFPTYILLLLIVFLVFLIIDLDRPRRGIIEVSQQSLTDLQSSLMTGRGSVGLLQ